MDDHLELLLFDMSTVYKVTHNVVQNVCSERGIQLTIYDITQKEDLKFSIQHNVRSFPTCILFRNGRRIGHTSIVWFRENNFSEWINEKLAEDEPTIGKGDNHAE